MNELQIRVTDTGRHQPYRLVNGLYKLDVGPSYATPREAMAFTDPASRPVSHPDLARAIGGTASRDEAATPASAPESETELRFAFGDR